MNWKDIARAHGLDLPAHDLERITRPLDALEQAFRPLVSTLSPGDEPDPELHIAEENQ
jgi:hypothetical protein